MDQIGAGERALTVLLAGGRTATAPELPGLIAAAARELGVRNCIAYLIDLSQTYLQPFGSPPAATGVSAEPLLVDSTLAGRVYQHGQVLTQSGADGSTVRMWLPLTNSGERLGVLACLVDTDRADEAVRGLLADRLHLLADLAGQLIATKSLSGDQVVRLRRRAHMGLAAELQWSLQPPMSFESSEVCIAGALEPAYLVAGDTLDYAIDQGILRAAVMDGMGHSLRSTQLAAIAVAGYRNARRSGLGLTETVETLHSTLLDAFDGEAFITGVFLEFNTVTGSLSWINAGHPLPLLIRGHQVIKNLECRPRPPLGLGLPRNVPVNTIVCQEALEPHDKFLLYTDGVVEARSPDGELFGETRLNDLLARHFIAELPGPETMRRVVHELLRHQQGPLSDDATLLLIEWDGTERSSDQSPSETESDPAPF